jgi:hypothetical protein
VSRQPFDSGVKVAHFVRAWMACGLICATQSEGQETSRADDKDAHQMLAFKEFGHHAFSQFILYRSGLVLFQIKAHRTEGLGWSQAQLNSEQMAAFGEVLRSQEFMSLRQGQIYQRPDSPDAVDASEICYPQQSGSAVVVEMRSKSDKTSSKAPKALARLLVLIKHVEDAQAAHWQPEWVNLILSHEARSLAPASSRNVPREWLLDAAKPEENVTRISGRYEVPLEDFLVEREKAGGPAGLGSETGYMSAMAVLPGRPACPESTGAIDEPLPAELEQQYRSPNP